jgi:hypothetical protein
MSANPVQLVREALERHGYDPRGSERQFMARCPGHDDRNPSLSVGTGSDGRALVNCFAGCATDDALAPIGLCLYDLFPDGFSGDLRTVRRTIGPSSAEPVSLNGAGGEPPESGRIEAVPIGDFAAVDEPGAGALLGSGDHALIPEGGDVMFYGDGGAGKTTLAVDLAFHLAAGQDWLGIAVPRPISVLMIENEGPRPMLRRKLGRKLGAWSGGRIEDRIIVLQRPWGQFTFTNEQWREQIAAEVSAYEIDVMIVGPLTRIGMDEAGTLQQVAAFMDLIADLRRRSGRRLAVIVVHHENKSGAVSGAWEGAGDALLHVQAAGNGHTVVYVQKARWDSERHGTTVKLAWTDGEGFRAEGDRDYLLEIRTLLSEEPWRTAKSIAAPKDKGGIGANVDTVKDVLNSHPELFEARTGEDAKALGFPKNATVYNVTHDAESPESAGDPHGGEEGQVTPDLPLRESGVSESPPLTRSNVTQTPESGPAQTVRCCCADGGAEPASDGRCSRCWGWPR